MSNIDFHCPRCKKRVSVTDSLAGRASACPVCREWLKVPGASEPLFKPDVNAPLLDALVEENLEPARILAETASRHDHPRGSVALGGWSCLLIALMLVVFLPPAFFVYLPLLLVAFIMGIVIMAKGHAFDGLALILATLILPLLVALLVDLTILGVGASYLSPLVKSGIQHIEQLQRSLALEPSEGVAEVAGDGEESPVEVPLEEFDGLQPSTKPDEWNAQEIAMEQSMTKVEKDWDRNMPDQEPNWGDRIDYWADQYRGRFVAPQAGMYVKLRLLSGGGAEGTLRHIGPASVTLQVPRGWVTYQKERLAGESRRNFFEEDFAQHYAVGKVRIEQELFQSRRGLSADAMSSRL